ncbi:hypothetical protein HOY80DRAFT_205139 [Tuber brumale]|nr:hypothetical protein HOY80DRAFT_205139 [Tuber brumale]
MTGAMYASRQALVLIPLTHLPSHLLPPLLRTNGKKKKTSTNKHAQGTFAQITAVQTGIFRIQLNSVQSTSTGTGTGMDICVEGKH